MLGGALQSARESGDPAAVEKASAKFVRWVPDEPLPEADAFR